MDERTEVGFFLHRGSRGGTEDPERSSKLEFPPFTPSLPSYPRGSVWFSFFSPFPSSVSSSLPSGVSG